MSIPIDSVISLLDARIEPIRSISPSKYLSARRCPLSYVLTKAKLWQFSPDNAAAVVGTAIHELIRWSGQSATSEVTHEQATVKFDELIEQAESKLSDHPLNRRLIPLSASDPRFPEKKHAAIKSAVRGVKSPRPSSSNRAGGLTKYMFEEGFSSKNKLIYGEVDKIVDGPRGFVIYDKKSCHVIDEEGYVKGEYRMQLLLYAGIVYEDIGVMADRLVLVDIDDREVEVPFHPDEALEELAVAARWLLSLNEKITQAGSILKLLHLAKPSPESCRYCPSRPICPSYWKARVAMTGEWPVDVEYEVESTIALGNNGKLIMAKPQGSGKSLRVAPEYVTFQPGIDGLVPGQKIRLINGKAQGRQHSLTKRSVVYVIGA
jgi:hypothetical protein